MAVADQPVLLNLALLAGNVWAWYDNVPVWWLILGCILALALATEGTRSFLVTFALIVLLVIGVVL